MSVISVLLFPYSVYRLYKVFPELKTLRQTKLRLEGEVLYLTEEKMNKRLKDFLLTNAQNNKIDLTGLLRVEYLPKIKKTATWYYEEITLVFSGKRRKVRFRNTVENTGELLTDLIAIARRQQKN